MPVDRHDAIFAVLDKRDKIPAEAFTDMLSKVTTDTAELALLQAIGQAAGPEGLATLAEVGRGNEPAERQLARLKALFEHLDLMGVGAYCRFDMGVVRGLAYYTGVVFEGFGKGGCSVPSAAGDGMITSSKFSAVRRCRESASGRATW